MLHSTIFFAVVTLSAVETAPNADKSIQPVANQHRLIERIFATGIGGDAETSGGLIINVVLREATDTDFKLLKDLKGVKYLDVAHCKIDGSGLANIVQMKRLEILWLHDNNFDVKHLKYINSFPKLHTLWLENTPTTNCSLRHLRKLKSLKQLYLANTKVTDAGLKHLQTLKNLTYVDLRDTKVTDQGIANLKQHLTKTAIKGPR